MDFYGLKCWWSHDWEEYFVSRVLIGGLLNPQQLKHGLNHVTDQILIILDKTLEKLTTFSKKKEKKTTPSFQSGFLESDHEEAVGRANGNSDHDVHVVNTYVVTAGRDLVGVQPLSVHTHVHLQESELVG